MNGQSEVLADFEQTIVAIASSAEPSSRGVVRLSGLDVGGILDRMDLETAGGGAAKRFDTEVDLGSPIGKVPVSLLHWPTERSYTGQPSAELHLLGSQPLLLGLVDRAIQAGARAARPGEFTLRAFLGGRLDLTQAEAVLGVIEAEERGALHQALEQLSGNLSRPLEAMRDETLNLLADVEAGLDFVDEDIEFISDDQLIERLKVILNQIDQTWETMKNRGGGSSDPVVTLRGEPNAGKSFLMNQLTQSDAAIVADVPGTTRDVVYSRARIGRREIRLADTAGIETGRCEVERQSQQHAKEASQQAMLRLWCVDVSRSDLDHAIDMLLEVSHSERKPSVIDCWIATKFDRCELSEPELLKLLISRLPAENENGRVHVCSALTGHGMNSLMEKIESLLDSIDREEIGSVLGTAARCQQSLGRARDAADAAMVLTTSGQGQEFVAAEIRLLAEALGEVTGAVYTDDLLDRVFSRFCIGK